MTVDEHLPEPVPKGWRVSSFSNNAGICIEVNFTDPGTVFVRDSKNRRGPVVAMPSHGWSAFLTNIDKRTRP